MESGTIDITEEFRQIRRNQYLRSLTQTPEEERRETQEVLRKFERMSGKPFKILRDRPKHME